MNKDSEKIISRVISKSMLTEKEILGNQTFQLCIDKALGKDINFITPEGGRANDVVLLISLVTAATTFAIAVTNLVTAVINLKSKSAELINSQLKEEKKYDQIKIEIRYEIINNIKAELEKENINESN